MGELILEIPYSCSSNKASVGESDVPGLYVLLLYLEAASYIEINLERRQILHKRFWKVKYVV